MNFPGSTMRELFSFADKNMYINKKPCKARGSGSGKTAGFPPAQAFKPVREKLFGLSLTATRTWITTWALRASADFFLASDGSYSGAAEQIAAERVARADRANIRQSLQVSELSGKLQAEGDLLELQYDTNGQGLYSRLTLIPVDWDEEGKLHHFLLAF